MKQQKKQLIIMIVLICLMGAAYFGFRQYNKIQENKPAEEIVTIPIVSLTSSETTYFKYIIEEETCEFEKIDGTWYAVSDHSLNLTQSLITAMLGSVTPLNAVQEIATADTDNVYGFDNPILRVTVGDGTTNYDILFGDYNSLTDTYYAKRADSDTVYSVYKSKVTVFCYSMNDLIEVEEEESEEATEAESTEVLEEGSDTEVIEISDEITDPEEEDTEASGEALEEENTESTDGEISESTEGSEVAEESEVTE